MFIIEAISKKGIKHTDAQFGRLGKPQPGDVLIWDDGPYPFNKNSDARNTEYGRFSNFGEWAENKFHVCMEPGSVFLFDDGRVSISGGPFHCIGLDEIEPTYTTKIVRFWNWGNNGSGAHQGVDYWIERPVFKYVPKNRVR